MKLTKITVSLLLSGVLLCFLYGCGTPTAVQPQVDFTARMTADIPGLGIEGRVTSTSHGLVTVSISYPEELSSLEYNFGNGFLMNYNGLSCTADDGYLNDSSFASVICSALQGLNENPECTGIHDGMAEFITKSPGGLKITVLTDLSGKICNISVKELNYCIDFAYE